ncbi:lipopolysaccharide biosynthesis protein [Bacteroides fragilis]
MSYSLGKQILRNTSFVFSAQILVLLISIARALILPKIFPVESFGYWSVYWFYTSYVGIFCLGFNDGIYLKFGEYNYEELPHKLIRSAVRLFTWMLFSFTAICILLIVFFEDNSNIGYALLFASLNVPVMGLTSVFIYIFQITNQFKRYSFFSIIDKILVLFTILYMLIVNSENFRTIIFVDLLSKLIVLLLMIWKTRELYFGKTTSFKESFRFMTENMSVGIKLMIANLMGMLLVGSGRIIVQLCGNIEDFAIYSFGMSVTGLVLTAVTAFSLVLYPMIKRISEDKYYYLFKRINIFTRSFGLPAILVYFPACWFITFFYPKYDSVLPFLNFLFAIVFLQCKISILNNTYYKVLRKEKPMLIANMNCVLIFTVLATVFYGIYREIWLIAGCTFVAMFIRCYESEIYLTKIMNGKIDKQVYVEIGFLLFFLSSSYLLSFIYSFVLSLLFCVAYFIFDRKQVKETFLLLWK